MKSIFSIAFGLILRTCLVSNNAIAARCADVRDSEVTNRDKSWTVGVLENTCLPEINLPSAVTARCSFQAEGTGFEPATGFPASDFESDR